MQSFELVLSIKLCFSLLYEIMNLEILWSSFISILLNLTDQLVIVLCNPVSKTKLHPGLD